jgi:hypothetical protein
MKLKMEDFLGGSKVKKIYCIGLLILFFTNLLPLAIYAGNGIAEETKIAEHGEVDQTETNESDGYNIVCLVIFGALIFGVLKLFSRLKFSPILTAITINVLTIISSLIQSKQFFEIIAGGLTGLILFGVYAANSDGGGYKHSRKDGGKDKRYKDNKYITIDADPIIRHCIFSFVLLLVIAIIYVLFFNEQYKQFFMGK